MDPTTPRHDAGGRPVRKLIDGPGFNHLIEGRKDTSCSTPTTTTSESASRSTASGAPARRICSRNWSVRATTSSTPARTSGSTRSPSPASSGRTGGCSPSSRSGCCTRSWPRTWRSTASPTSTRTTWRWARRGDQSGWPTTSTTRARPTSGGVPLAAIARQADDERPRYRLPIMRLTTSTTRHGSTS